MSSPLANPTPFVNTINQLGAASRSLDESVDQVKRGTGNLVTTYGRHFQIVSDLSTNVHAFNDRWVDVLLRSRDAASSIAGWYKRFNQVFLSLVSDIQTDQDRRDVVTEFKQFLTETNPSAKFDLESISGLKQEFVKIEALLPEESKRVIQVLEGATGLDWKDVVQQLQTDLVPVQSGCAAIERAFAQYATKL